MSHIIGSQPSGQSSVAVVGSSGGSSAQTSQPSEQKYDLITKVRQLVWALKESLAVRHNKTFKDNYELL